VTRKKVPEANLFWKKGLPPVPFSKKLQ
jgi:hypothetical protein